MNGHKFQITTDQYPGYKDSIPMVFGDRVHYASIKKIYGGDGTGREGYSPAALRGTKTRIISGNPERDKICTSFVERQNLTIRTQCKRFTRLTNAFSKQLQNLKASMSLHFWHYNFMRIHSSIKMTPAMASGISNRALTWGEVM